MEQHYTSKLWKWGCSFRARIEKEARNWSRNVPIASWNGVKITKVLFFNSVFGYEKKDGSARKLGGL